MGLAVGDVCLYAAAEEDAANEMILLQAVDTLRTALSSLMKYVFKKDYIVEFYRVLEKDALPASVRDAADSCNGSCFAKT